MTGVCSDPSDDTVSIEAEAGYTTTTLSASLTLRLPPPKYRVEHEPRCGRLLVATAHIAAGDTVLVDTPACLGPDNNTRPGITRTLWTRV